MKDNLYVREVRISKEIPHNNYLCRLPVVRSLRETGGLHFHKKVTFIVGENGIGKSTLIEGLAVAMGFFLRAESFYNVASNIDELDAVPSFGPILISNYGGVSLHKQSHGESFMALVEKRFGGNGLYILDAPEKIIESLLGDE